MIKVPVNLITAIANSNPHGTIKKKKRKRENPNSTVPRSNSSSKIVDCPSREKRPGLLPHWSLQSKQIRTYAITAFSFPSLRWARVSNKGVFGFAACPKFRNFSCLFFFNILDFSSFSI
jgi:hypothetical protein